MKAEPKGVADIIPGDFVSNAVLASAWDIHNQWLDNIVLHNYPDCVADFAIVNPFGFRLS